MMVTTNDWECYDKAGLVPLGSHSLFVSTNGPPRKLKAPVVIFITGGGAPTELYIHLHRAIAKFARNYFPDRAGYGRSERPRGSENQVPHEDQPAGRNPSPDGQISAEDSAIELRKLMLAIDVKPPYVLAAHSYGGIIARTYYALFPDDIAGMALLDTNSELLQQCLGPIPPPAYASVCRDVDPEKVTHLREASGMTDAEFMAALAAIERTKAASADEATHQSGRQLARHKQPDKKVMGQKPLIVVCSNMAGYLRLIFEEGVRLGGGTEEERREAEWWMETVGLYTGQVQRVQMELSSDAECIALEMWHDFPIRDPGRTADMIRRLLLKVEEHMME